MERASLLGIFVLTCCIDSKIVSSVSTGTVLPIARSRGLRSDCNRDCNIYSLQHIFTAHWPTSTEELRASQTPICFEQPLTTLWERADTGESGTRSSSSLRLVGNRNSSTMLGSGTVERAIVFASITMLTEAVVCNVPSSVRDLRRERLHSAHHPLRPMLSLSESGEAVLGQKDLGVCTTKSPWTPQKAPGSPNGGWWWFFADKKVE